MRKRANTRRSAGMEEAYAPAAEDVAGTTLKRRKVVDLNELLGNKTTTRKAEEEGEQEQERRGGLSSEEVTGSAERRDREREAEAAEEDDNRYSRRRRKPAQAWWIASSEKEELLHLAPMDTSRSSNSNSNSNMKNMSSKDKARAIKSKIKSHLKNFQKRRKKLRKSKQQQEQSRPAKLKKQEERRTFEDEEDDRVREHDSDLEFHYDDADDVFALEPLTPSPSASVRHASKTAGGNASPSMRPLYLEKKSKSKSKNKSKGPSPSPSPSPKAAAAGDRQDASACDVVAEVKVASEQTGASTLLKNPLDEAEEVFKRLKSNTIVHQEKLSTSASGKKTERFHFSSLSKQGEGEGEGEKEKESVNLHDRTSDGKAKEGSEESEAARSLGYVGRSFINCIESHEMFGKKCTLVHYNTSRRIWTLKYEEEPKCKSSLFADWFDLLDLLSYEFCDQKGKRGVVEKIQEMKNKNRTKMDMEVDTTQEQNLSQKPVASPTRATILDDALDSNKGAQAEVQSPQSQAQAQKSSGITGREEEGQPQPQDGSERSSGEEHIHDSAGMAEEDICREGESEGLTEEGEKKKGNDRSEMNENGNEDKIPSVQLYSPQQLNTSMNYVKTMCSLWEEEEPNASGAGTGTGTASTSGGDKRKLAGGLAQLVQEDAYDISTEISTPVLQRAVGESIEKNSSKLAANSVGGSGERRGAFQEQTSSDQQLMDLLATPRSTEVTPESKPNANTNTNANANANDASGLRLSVSAAAANAQEQHPQDPNMSVDQVGYAVGGTPTHSHPILVIPRQILNQSMGADKAAVDQSHLSGGSGGVGNVTNSNTTTNVNTTPILSKNSSARKKLRLCCDREHKEYLQNELCNLLINKKIIKHWREGNDWASKDVTGKELDAYRIAELEERLLSTAREARALMEESEISQISKRAHQLWTQLKVKYSCENKSPQRPLKGILKDPLIAKPTTATNKKVTFLTELIEFGSPMKIQV